MAVPVLAGEGAFGAGFAENIELGGSEMVAPLVLVLVQGRIEGVGLSLEHALSVSSDVVLFQQQWSAGTHLALSNGVHPSR
jgi:hypothetical protein